ncbi:NADPH:quinone reductase-like Zn-dependent oxidoreductase [Streptomyces sp. 3330]|uniref:NADP-dependent oxidoreductase n=1 Tax=Streptomyces sp. 3330 TaxID=2817755 RepID=UPI00286692FF|nr:NADP-dependent oxidoreductase [Streptomyces sp. 3330]MDR6974321.1 NADPH:quinone reductase-like Zn-dependent oxidoreductase [Streptomyces sp. 3330]
MPRAVQFSRYGGPEVLEIAQVPRPAPGPGEVVVRVVVAPVNPGEAGIRQGVFAGIWPASFPEGQGNDFAGWVTALGEGVDSFAIGDEVIGYLPRAAQADYVVSPAHLLAAKPAEISWESAAPLSAVGVTAWAAVNAVDVGADDTVVVSAAAGGVGSLAAQLARLRGATVIGTAGPHNADFLRSLGVIPVQHGPGLTDRLRVAAPNGIDAFIDTFGQGNVDAAIALGVPPHRINTIADGRAVALHGVHSQAQEDAFSPRLVAELASLVAQKRLTVPISAIYSLEQVQDAYRQVQQRHTRGKIVLSLVPENDRAALARQLRADAATRAAPQHSP